MTTSGELWKRFPSAPPHPSCSSASPVQLAVHLGFDLAALYGLRGPLTRSPRPPAPTARESWRSWERLGASRYSRWWRSTSPLRRRSKVLSSHRRGGGSGYSLSVRSCEMAPSCLGTGRLRLGHLLHLAAAARGRLLGRRLLGPRERERGRAARVAPVRRGRPQRALDEAEQLVLAALGRGGELLDVEPG